MVLDVGADLRVRLDEAAELRLPVAVADHPVDVAAARVGLPAGRLRGGEVDVDRRAGRVVWVEHRGDGALAEVARHDAARDAGAGLIRQLLVHELGGVGAALADQVIVQPAAGDPLELAEQVQLRLLFRVAPVVFQQGLGEMVDQRRRAQILAVDQTQVDAFADDPGVVGDGRTDDLRREHERRVVVERCVHVLFGQFHAVALDAREADLAGIPLRRDRPDGYGLARLRLFGHHRLGGEVERDAEHVGVFDVEQAVFVQIVGLAA